MSKNRAITYSLLAHIRNKGTLIKGPLDIFIPLVKRTISLMNSKLKFSGENIIEIKNEFESLYSIDIPFPVLKNILVQIAREVNTEKETFFVINKDNSFNITKYTFLDYEETILAKESSIKDIEILYKQFCETSEYKNTESDSIFNFIEKNKFLLSKYFSEREENISADFTSEAQFINFFRKFPSVYTKIKDIYLGSIISSFIQYNPSETKIGVELLFDTNFIIGLLDLNTPESTHTCQTLVSIAKKQNYKIRVLKGTIEETRNLLFMRAKHFDESFLYRKVYREDIYNACDRRKLKKSDLEKISDNLENEIHSFGISIINDQNLKKEAKFSSEYKFLKEIRRTEFSALHDATALLHVKKTREKKIKEFEKVNSWFVNNVTGKEITDNFDKNGFQPETINADSLLNILWLSNPQSKIGINANDLADIGITSSISLALNKNLPKSKIILELDDNIHKYANENISDSDIVRIATRITNKQLEDLDKLNELAKNNKEEFVKRLQEEANKQKIIDDNRNRRLENILKEYNKKSAEISKKEKEIELKKALDLQQIEKLKSNSNKLINNLVDNEILKWKKPINYLIPLGIIIVLFYLMMLFFKNFEYNYSQILLKYIDSIESEALRVTLIGSLLLPFGFLVWIINYCSERILKIKILEKRIKLQEIIKKKHLNDI